MILKNFHTHTVFCDGIDAPEDIVIAAIEQGLSALGFSGHSYTPFDTSYCMKQKETAEYAAVINHLKKKYAEKIRIYCGIEKDCYSPDFGGSFDYTIGAVHYIKVCGEYLPVDLSEQQQKEDVKKYFGGSFDAYCEKYFETVAATANKTHADFIAHFDLVTKFNEGDALFSTRSVRFVKAWQAAADTLLKSDIPFEINTGAMARGKRTSPYPSPDIAEYITARGGRLILNSDCHDKNKLLFAFSEAENTYSRFGICDFEEILSKKKGFIL